MSATIYSDNHADSDTVWAGQGKTMVRAPKSQRRLGLLLMAASTAFMIYALWTIGGLIGRLLGL